MDSLLRKWLKNPFQIGSIYSSSRELALLMVSQIPEDAKVIVEFGAGSGPITEVIHEKFPNAQIIAFELDAELAQKVQNNLPNVQVLADDVTKAHTLLPAEICGNVDVILSSLPFLTLPKGLDQKIIDSAFQILKPGASFVQFTYLPVLPPIQIYKELNLWAQFVGSELKNIPPAFVWSFRQERRKLKRK